MLRSGLSFRFLQFEIGVFHCEVFGRRRLSGAAALRRARLPHRKLRGGEGFRPRLHEDVSHSERKSQALEPEQANSANTAGDSNSRGAFSGDERLLESARNKVASAQLCSQRARQETAPVRAARSTHSGFVAW